MSVAAPLPEELEVTIENQALSEGEENSKALRIEQVR